MESIFKMATFRSPISPSEPCIFAIFKPKNFKFWILIENYITTNDTYEFFDKLSISLIINYISSHFLSSHLDIEFRVNLMIHFGSKNHKKINRNKKKNGGENDDGCQA
jgi:hypothetical protein